MQTIKPKSVPKHLRKYTVDQNYENYTAINHAVWRYVMRQNHNLLKDKAHEAYTDGLKASAISIEQIPNVDEMNESLAQFGWGAATIDGFIPGVAFFEFQAHGILPVVNEIRKLENILYTPAPDIIHEAAGHAPILADPEYSAFVKRFGEIGMKALATKEEHDHFEAVRHYSNLLEKGEATDEQILEAKQQVEEREAQITELSEAQIVGRFYWWTVEFGLIGTLDDPKIYGAGLLSSVGEGSNALSDDVDKLPFDKETVIKTDFDITKPQPHLFVCESFGQLSEAAEELAQSMAFMQGGTESLDKAVKSGHTATAVMSSGLQITGTIADLLKNDQGEAIWFTTDGATALAVDDQQLVGHGSEQYPEGFQAPIGEVINLDQPLETLTDDELVANGIHEGERVSLIYNSGIEINGEVESIIKRYDKVVLLRLKNGHASLGQHSLVTFEEESFDLAIGMSVISVFAGAADGESFHTAHENENEGTESTEDTPLNALFAEIREIRENNPTVEAIKKIHQELNENHPHEWLSRLELLEILNDIAPNDPLTTRVETELHELQEVNDELHTLIERGLSIIE
ncbi:aromatic amino acid hydroxylase [Alkalibacillus sp. S2W]|uniref:aromatic amino acid hydroxylase n=1 Tax=Alkalibacillus sp. S2W TaxID=3386553 RepID=UPI00398CECFD